MARGRLDRQWQQTALIAWASYHAMRGKETRLTLEHFNLFAERRSRGTPITTDVLKSLKPRITGKQT